MVTLGWVLVAALAAYLGRLFYRREIRPYRGTHPYRSRRRSGFRIPWKA